MADVGLSRLLDNGTVASSSLAVRTPRWLAPEILGQDAPASFASVSRPLAWGGSGERGGDVGRFLLYTCEGGDDPTRSERYRRGLTYSNNYDTSESDAALDDVVEPELTSPTILSSLCPPYPPFYLLIQHT